MPFEAENAVSVAEMLKRLGGTMSSVQDFMGEAESEIVIVQALITGLDVMNERLSDDLRQARNNSDPVIPSDMFPKVKL